VLATTRSQRFWNWLGSVPHWIYFTKLRANQPAWRQVNLWIAGPAILVAVSGIWIGILRLRVGRRYPNGQHSPYHGWKHWHHWAGIVGGVFLLTWILSGWLSVNPNQWLSGGAPTSAALLRYAGQSSLTFDTEVARIAERAPACTRRARFMYLDATPVVELSCDATERTVLDARTGQTMRVDDARLFDAARRLMPEHRIIESKRLSRDDLYWYSHHERRPLPVLRVAFDDPEHSWFYLDPSTGEVLDFMDDGTRSYRWWFNALHRLDFTWLLRYPALWRAVVWSLCAAGLLISASGIVIGWRRLRR
jgi:hypothetical protein